MLDEDQLAHEALPGPFVAVMAVLLFISQTLEERAVLFYKLGLGRPGSESRILFPLWGLCTCFSFGFIVIWKMMAAAMEITWSTGGLQAISCKHTYLAHTAFLRVPRGI